MGNRSHECGQPERATAGRSVGGGIDRVTAALLRTAPVAKNKGRYSSREGERAPEPIEAALGLVEQAAESARPYMREIFVAVGVVVVGVAGLSLWNWNAARRDSSASTALDGVLSTARAEIVVPESADAGVAAGPPAPKSDEEQYVSEQARTEAALARLAKLEKEHGSADVAKNALVLEGAMLFDLGRWDDALRSYRRAALKATDATLVRVAREGIGYTEEAKALAEKTPAAREAGLKLALVAFAALQPDAKGAGFDLATYHQARVKAALGERDAALVLYRAARAASESTALKQQIDNRVATLEERKP